MKDLRGCFLVFKLDLYIDLFLVLYCLLVLVFFL